MKVLHVLCDLSGGGAERLVLDLCRFSTVETAVATVHRGGELDGAFSAAGVSVRCADRRRGRAGLRATARLARWASQVDVVHTHLWAGDTWGRPAAWLGGCRAVVTTEHNTRADSPLRSRIWTAMAPLSDRIVCVSRSAAQTLADAGIAPDRLTVIDNGVDLSRFSSVPRPGAGVLAVGRLTRQKGFDVLLDALRLSPVPTTILGEGEDRGLLESRAVGLPVTLPGWRSDIRPALRAAAVLVIPSRWEGFGLIAVEAMASGVPVIASGVDGLAEVVGDAGVLVPPEDPVALSAAIRRLLADPDLQADLRQRGLSRARQLSIERTVARYEALYREISSREISSREISNISSG
jgi:glycosyltransferase involved in cell wall biosynthesis